MSAWFNNTFFDTINDLLLGESYDDLDTGTFQPTVDKIISAAKGVTLFGMAQRFWPLTYILLLFIPKNIREAKNQHCDLTRARIQQRLQCPNSNNDMISTMSEFIDAPGPTTISQSELCYTASLIILAGSEPSATTLSFFFHHLL
ncbi:hypothetical protein ONS95_003623 [Cadophora gregata]|uniref:uncharacterized protein n=1 Tax=Cadophora gregata TaxID=51156 RepID=UPI0026DB4381|nr:uncharacterized protein ONS95_003623 [Cadophora gregata]KAK0106906.1 hypothetical protein ONS95_003623 [Cadophora gregata]KAK0116594.1 hypothetical protein ONS96_012451 [Cadophora gregata f. sp. sojae]